MLKRGLALIKKLFTQTYSVAVHACRVCTVRPTMAGFEPGSQHATLEDRQASLDADAAIPSWATDGLAER